MGWFKDLLTFTRDTITDAVKAGKPKLEDPITGELQSEKAKREADAAAVAASKKP